MHIQQHGGSLCVQLSSFHERWRYIGRVGDGDSDGAQTLSDLGVVTGHLGGAEAFASRWIASRVGCHTTVVQEDGRDRGTGSNRGLDVESGHPESTVAHEVETEFFGFRQFGTNHQWNAVTEVRRFAPTYVTVRNRRGVKRHYRVPRGACVMGDDAVFAVQGLVQLADHPVGVDGNFIRFQQRLPLGEPIFFELTYRRRHPSLFLAS